MLGAQYPNATDMTEMLRSIADRFCDQVRRSRRRECELRRAGIQLLDEDEERGQPKRGWRRGSRHGRD